MSERDRRKWRQKSRQSGDNGKKESKTGITRGRGRKSTSKHANKRKSTIKRKENCVRETGST